MTPDPSILVTIQDSKITSFTVGSARHPVESLSTLRYFVVGRDPSQFSRAPFGSGFPSAIPERTPILVPSEWVSISRVHCLLWMNKDGLQILTHEQMRISLSKSAEVLASGLRICVDWRRTEDCTLTCDDLVDLPAPETISRLKQRLSTRYPDLDFSPPHKALSTITLGLGDQLLRVGWRGTAGPAYRELHQLLHRFEEEWHAAHEIERRARIREAAEACDRLAAGGRWLREAHARVCDAAIRGVPLVLGGETGTGKTRLASCYHAHSERSRGNFVYFDCALYGPDETRELKAYLFGALKGAWTGLDHDIKGAVEKAKGGVLFLDEVGELKPELQSLLLRFLQDGAFERLGDKGPHRSDARLVFATNRDLWKAAELGTFREDLLYRMTLGEELQVEPLRRRPDELRALLERAARIEPYAPLDPVWDRLTPAAQELLLRHEWRGNFRAYERFRLRFPRGRAESSVTEEECSELLGERGSGRAAEASGLAGGLVSELEALLPQVDARWRERVARELDEAMPEDAEPTAAPVGADLYERLRLTHERARARGEARGSKGFLPRLSSELLPLYVGWRASVLQKQPLAALPKVLNDLQRKALARDLLTLDEATIRTHYRAFLELRDRVG